MADPRSPKLIEDYVRVTYWSCDVVGHRHATERAAHRCIGLRPGGARLCQPALAQSAVPRRDHGW